MRIDSHQHFWRYNPEEYDWIDDCMASLRRDFLPSDLEPALARSGFHACVAVQARQTVEETRFLLELANANPFVVGVVGWVDLRLPDVKSQLEEFSANHKLLGIRHVVQSEPDDRFLLRPEFMRGIALLEQFDLSYDLLIYPRHLPAAAEFVRHFPRQRFVLDHLAKPLIKSGSIEPWRSGIRELAHFPNVFCKLSGLVTEAEWNSWTPGQIGPYIDVAFECFGPERLMIGSDWPVCTVAASYSRVMNVIIDYLDQYASHARERVLGGTAAEFWRLQAAAG